MGGGPKSGVTFPDFGRLSEAFGLPYRRCSSHHEMAQVIEDTLVVDGPAVCEIILDENIPFAPKLGAKQLPDGRITSPALEDLSPFLSREQLKDNMLIDLIEDQ